MVRGARLPLYRPCCICRHCTNRTYPFEGTPATWRLFSLSDRARVGRLHSNSTKCNTAFGARRTSRERTANLSTALSAHISLQPTSSILSNCQFLKTLSHLSPLGGRARCNYRGCDFQPLRNHEKSFRRFLTGVLGWPMPLFKRVGRYCLVRHPGKTCRSSFAQF